MTWTYIGDTNSNTRTLVIWGLLDYTKERKEVKIRKSKEEAKKQNEMEEEGE